MSRVEQLAQVLVVLGLFLVPQMASASSMMSVGGRSSADAAEDGRHRGVAGRQRLVTRPAMSVQRSRLRAPLLRAGQHQPGRALNAASACVAAIHSATAAVECASENAT